MWNDNSGTIASLYTPLDDVEYEWARWVGPQNPVEYGTTNPNLPTTNDFWLTCPGQGDPANLCDGVGTEAFAYVCVFDAASNAYCNADARNIYYAFVYVKESSFANQSLQDRREIASHEFGHTLALKHHDGQGCLMDPDVPGDTNTHLPQIYPCEQGGGNPFSSPALSPCSTSISSNNYGIRCIYDWWREQRLAAPNDDCYDVTRDGDVAGTDYFAALAAFGGFAGEAPYHPDADTNGNGSVAGTDLLSIVGQFGHNCATDHYYRS